MSSLLDHPMVCSEQWEKFTEIDHEIWKTLFNRHTELLKNRATNEIVEGIEKLKICNDRIPKFSELNRILMKETNFSTKLTLCYSKYAKNSYYTAMFYSEALHNIP